jgi:dihydroorotase
MAPPLRSEEDRQAVLAGLQDGSIAAIATDHAPHATQDKEFEFELAANGVVGLETAWGLTYRLVREHVLSLRRAVELLTCGPARAFGLGTAGTLRKGAWADLVLVDPEGTQRVVAPQLQSKSKNTPFKGWELPSRVERTVFHGRTVWLWDGEQGTVGAEAEGG